MMRISLIVLFSLAILPAQSAIAELIVPTHIIAELQETKDIDETTISVNGGSGQFDVPDNDDQVFPFTNGGSFSFAESGMSSSPNIFLQQNRHEFRFSADGVSPITLDGDVPWMASLDITINTPNPGPRKSFAFSLYESNAGLNGGANSNVNLTTSATPANNTNKGVNITPGESAMFGGQFPLQRVIGPCDTNSTCGDADLNPTVGYVTGSQISMTMVHTPSPDGGITPSQFQYFYDDGSAQAPYTNVLQTLRNTPAMFVDDYEIGFVILGVGINTIANDSYSVEIENFQLDIGNIDGDFDLDYDVDGADFLAWQRGKGIMGTATLQDGDANGDTNVNATDLAIWQSQYGTGGGGSMSSLATVPEPSSGVLALLGILAFTQNYLRHFRGLEVKPPNR